MELLSLWDARSAFVSALVGSGGAEFKGFRPEPGRSARSCHDWIGMTGLLQREQGFEQGPYYV